MTKPQDPIEAITVSHADAPVAHAACQNCRTVLQGAYCHVCGQYSHNPLKSFKHAVEDVFESFWHVDGRIFRTLRDLLIPGRVINRYLDGQRVGYIAPLRLFVILSLLTFFVAHFLTSGVSGAAIRVQDEAYAKATTVAEVEAARAKALQRIEADASQPTANATERMLLDVMRDQTHAAANERLAQLGAAPATPPATPSTAGTAAGDFTDGVLHGVSSERTRTERPRSKLGAWVQARLTSNAQRYRNDKQALVNDWLTAVPKVLFVLVPVFALLLRVAYVYKPMGYLEHLVVALYSHAYLLLGALLCMLLLLATRHTAWAGTAEAAVGWITAGMCLSLLWVQKRVYRQGWAWTALNYVVIGTLYSTLLGLGALVALGTAFLK